MRYLYRRKDSRIDYVAVALHLPQAYWTQVTDQIHITVILKQRTYFMAV